MHVYTYTYMKELLIFINFFLLILGFWGDSQPCLTKWRVAIHPYPLWAGHPSISQPTASWLPSLLLFKMSLSFLFFLLETHTSVLLFNIQSHLKENGKFNTKD